ncbi:MAG: hypothetical protein HC916_13960 [Coleofasciculaceae cyanobacterium SM2_1_6]|nr:hypothetical protein [Coleofasciculaceae cyanobacterium SM2_1_6]
MDEATDKTPMNLDNSVSNIQSEAHKEANTAVTKAMAVYWSWIAAGLLPDNPESKLDHPQDSSSH